MAGQEAVEGMEFENDFHVSSDINLEVEGDIRVAGVSSDEEDQTTLDEPISTTLVWLLHFLYCILDLRARHNKLKNLIKLVFLIIQ